VVLASQGRTAKAAEALRRSLELANAQGKKDLAAQVRANLARLGEPPTTGTP
jgi:hypothetical protein